MTSTQRKLRRRQLDELLSASASGVTPPPPPGGWVKALREALGMTLETFGSRLGGSRQTAHQLEQSEATGSITIKRLRTAADAMECELVVFLRPKRSLESIVQDRAHAVARRLVSRTEHSMVLEKQAVAESRIAEMVEEMAAELISNRDPRVWQ